MTKIIDIKTEALKSYEDFLSAFISGNNDRFFPIELRYSKPQRNDDRSVLKAKIDYLEKHSKSALGWGYEIEWEPKGSRAWNEINIPARVYFSNEEDFLKFIGKSDEYCDFMETVKMIISQIPELNEWIKENPLEVVKNKSKWPDLLRVCSYFKSDHLPNQYFIRELPISGIHTKFIENNATILRSLLDFLIQDKINPLEKDFHLRYNLKSKEKLIRVRILCSDLALKYPYNDFSIQLSDFVNNEITSHNIFIAENEMNFLTLPSKQNSIAIWSGGGFQISYLANIDWFKGKQIYYWGDIDAAGLSILSQLRTYYPSTQSILMDRATFERYYENGKSEKAISAKLLKGLTLEELNFFNYLNENKFRLEQEKIPQFEIQNIMSLII